MTKNVLEPSRRTLSELGLEEAWLETWFHADPKETWRALD